MAVEVPHRRRWTFAGSSDGGIAEDGFTGRECLDGRGALDGALQEARERVGVRGGGVARVDAGHLLGSRRRHGVVGGRTRRHAYKTIKRENDVADCGAGVSLGVRFFLKRDVF